MLQIDYNKKKRREKRETEKFFNITRESEEMYLETSLLLHRKKANVRAVDVCDELSYVKSSVSRGVNLLKKKGYITIDVATGDIEFTDTGRKKAEGIYERHKILTAALCKIGADPELAEENACRIEHVISEETFERLKVAHIQSEKAVISSDES